MAVSFLLIYGDDMMRYNYVYTVHEEGVPVRLF